MTNKEYQKPSMRVRHITYETALCDPSLPQNLNDTISGESAWGKEGNLEEESLDYKPYSVWED